jgi:hypothetical protein
MTKKPNSVEIVVLPAKKFSGQNGLVARTKSTFVFAKLEPLETPLPIRKRNSSRSAKSKKR